jgi:hypothetical protein
LGGLPASAFLTNPLHQSATSDTNARTTTTGTTTYQYITAGAINVVPKFINATDLGGSQIMDTGVGVGLGTSTPQEMLDVRGRAILRSTSRGPAGLWLGTNDPSSAFIGSANAAPDSPMVFSHGGLARLTILPNGRIGIGTDSPTVALDVQGDIRLGSGALYFSDGTWLSSSAGVGGGSASISAGDSSIAIGSSGASTTVAVATQGISTAKLADNSVTTLKIADGSITALKLAPGAINSIGLPTLGANTFTADQTIRINSPNGIGISSINSATTNEANAIYGETASTNGVAIKARTSSATGQSAGVYAISESSAGYGVYSVENSTTGINFGVYGKTRSSSGTGVMGESAATTGTAYGVYGLTAGGTYSTGVYGLASSTTAPDIHYGVYGKANGVNGIGVVGFAANPSMTNASPIGVLGRTLSPVGVAGQFINSAATGNILIAQNNFGNVWRVDNAGNEYMNGTSHIGGADFAEAILPVKAALAYEPGDVLVIATSGDRKVELANESYSTRVIGVYATKPGVLASRHGIDDTGAEIPVAMIGIVPVKASAENGPIHRGDLLVTAATAGHVMRATDRSQFTGAIVGKAMQSLESGTGVIEIAVTLQ